MRPSTVICGSLRQIRAKLETAAGPLRRALSDRPGGCSISVLAERFDDPALGELVLADDALGVDA